MVISPYLCPEVRGESNKVEISENWKVTWVRPCRGGSGVVWYLKQITLSYIICLKVVFWLCWWICTDISSIFSLSVHPWNTPLWMTLVPWHVPFAGATSVTSAYQHTRLVALEFSLALCHLLRRPEQIAGGEELLNIYLSLGLGDPSGIRLGMQRGN